MVDQVPRVLAGRYEVGELIGRGGMAEVHIGRDNRLSRRVAIKLLRSDLAQDSTFQARFRREAQSAAALNHPAIVSVYDTGEDTHTGGDGVAHHLPFIVMEYVEGHTVRELIRDGAALPLDEAVEITSGVLSALEYSHHAGIVHRDIKPANVMITTAGDVKVMDFGIARAMADSAATMTQTQAVVGTAQYLSPEQARGEVVDARSDVYSTGALLFELLTGRPPFIGDSPVAVAYQHVREEPPTPSALAPDVPNELDRITLKALAKDRNVRYQSAEEFRADLEAAQRGGIVGAPAVGVIAAANAAAAAAGSAASRGAATQVLGGPPTATTSSNLPPVPLEDEEEPRKGRAWIWVLSAIAVVLVGVIIAIAVANSRNAEPEPTPTTPVETATPTPTPTPTIAQVQVPDVAGESEAAARRLIEAEGLEFVATPTPSDSVEAGLAIGSNPTAGQSLDPGTQVEVQISTGPDALRVPAVLGMTQQQAETAISQAGFSGNTIRVETENSATAPAGSVIRIDPAVDSEVAVDADFTLVVASGQADVPSLEGMDQGQAETALRDAGFLATTDPEAARGTTYEIQTEPSGDFDAGFVTRWTPEGTANFGTRITVWIATEPVETAAPTQAPTPTPRPGDGDGD